MNGALRVVSRLDMVFRLSNRSFRWRRDTFRSGVRGACDGTLIGWDVSSAWAKSATLVMQGDSVAELRVSHKTLVLSHSGMFRGVIIPRMG